jgi:hypothetical protein
MAVAMILDRLFDRRQFPRCPVAEHHGPVTARVRPGRDVELIDLSRGGALVQAAGRLMPGSQVELQIAVGHWRWNGTAHVVRCHVSALSLDDHVRYRAAFRFARPMDPGSHDQFDTALRSADATAASGYQVPAAGSTDPW